MDEIVKQAMAKWPDVPHCYGWLALDARGHWRMRDESAQADQQAGERIEHAALISFINRNYTHDEQGQWYFQNGPQRVYVNLAATPYIAHTDPTQGFVVQTGVPLGSINTVWLDEEGALILQAGEVVAQVDDRDMAQCLGLLRSGENGDHAASEEVLLAWLDHSNATIPPLYFGIAPTGLPVQRIKRAELARHFGFVNQPHSF